MSKGKKQQSNIDRLAKRMERYASAERLILMRNLGYGGAAACLVILAQLAQVGAEEISLKVTVVATSISLPLWFLLGASYECYIFLGKQSYTHLRTEFAQNFLGFVMMTAGLALIAAIGGLIWYLMPEAVFAFGITILFSIILAIVFYNIIARWWFGSEGPGSGEHKDEN